MIRTIRSAFLLLAALALPATVVAQTTFADVQPILEGKCASCHTAAEAGAGLRLDDWEAMMRGSTHGEAVIPFDPANSLLLELESKLEEPHSVVTGHPLTEGEVARLTQWVADGARGPAGEIPFETIEDPLYAASQGSAMISIIDTEHHVVARNIHLRELGFTANARPHHVAVEPDGSYWYVSLIGENRILKFDASDNSLVSAAEFEVPGMLALHPNEDVLFVGRSMMAVNPPQRIGRVETASMEVDEVDIFFPRPHALAVSPSGEQVYSASLGTNQMAVVDTETGQLELSGLDGPQHAPVQFAISPDGATMVAATQLTGRVMFFDLADPYDPHLIREVEVGGMPWHPLFTPDGSSVWMARKGADVVTSLNAMNGQVERVIRHPGLSQPHGSAIRSDGRYVYFSSNNMNGAYTPRFDLEDNGMVGTVAVIDTATGEVVKILEVENNATGLGIRAAN